MNKRILCGTIAALALLASSALARAGDITYTVNLTVGTGSVVGTIITDGATGTLASSDIVGGTLLIDGLGYSDSAGLPAAIHYFIGDDLSATADSLLFNFSGTDGGGFAFGTAAQDPYWNVGTLGFVLGADPNYPGMDIFVDNVGVTDTAQMSGEVVIAQVVNVTPEPGTLTLLASGLLGLMLLARVNRAGVWAAAKRPSPTPAAL